MFPITRPVVYRALSLGKYSMTCLYIKETDGALNMITEPDRSLALERAHLVLWGACSSPPT